MPDYDSRLMALRGRIGAHVAHSRHDSRDLTKNARAAFRQRFEREVDPAGTLTPQERQRRADQARRAHFARLALASAQKRRLQADNRARPPIRPGEAGSRPDVATRA